MDIITKYFQIHTNIGLFQYSLLVLLQIQEVKDVFVPTKTPKHYDYFQQFSPLTKTACTHIHPILLATKAPQTSQRRPCLDCQWVYVGDPGSASYLKGPN